MTTRAFTRALFLGVALASPTTSSAQMRLSPLIGDGMVIQRGVQVPVWGWSAPGARITVTLDHRGFSARAGADGAWRVLLPALPAGGPHELRIAGPDTALDVRDVLAGDVWLCSGQSNMELTVAEARDAAGEIAAARDAGIRHFKVPRGWATTPAADIAGGRWEPADPAHVAAFTAAGYYFARALRRDLDVPIGLLNSSWGGSRIEAWMSGAALGLDSAALGRVWAAQREQDERLAAALRARIGDPLPRRDGGLVGGEAVWAAPDLNDAGWAALPVPGLWETAGYDGLDGVAWYRTSFELTADEAARGVRLGLGKIDDSDIAWVNGREVGRTQQAYNQPRLYKVPAEALRVGRNVLAVRVEDTGGGGGIWGDSALLYLESGSARRSLAGTWKFQVGSVTSDSEADKNQVPTALYNRMIHPLLEYPVRGVLWYQGESNADRMADARAYAGQLQAMIRAWRSGWKQPALPFLFVQLPNYMPADSQPSESAWALLRESQSAALALPATAQVVAIDLGEAGDIHPRNKQDVGARLALAARKVAYAEDLVYSGPTYVRHEVRGGRVVVRFQNLGGGLVARGATGDGGGPGGFAIAGADRRFVWAHAAIEGDRVVVWSERVPEPVAVRYGWGNNPDGANLFNREGLPAAPFRTDAW